MPPDMAVSMRRTKLKAEEAAMIAGEVVKPSWESRNEGIHERVSFEDCIWGFDLAGGAYYRTPLRVTYVKPDSRAEKAGIRPGDRLLRINGVDTSTLTIQEAHEMILESGIHLRVAVTSPEDKEDAIYYYEDPIIDDYITEEQRRIEEEKARKRQVHARVSSYWSLQWPWVSKRRIIYRESNCFMVPSKYEENHKDRFTAKPSVIKQEDIVLQSACNTSKSRIRGQKLYEEKESEKSSSKDNSNENMLNGYENNNTQNGTDENDLEEIENKDDSYSDRVQPKSNGVDDSLEESIADYSNDELDENEIAEIELMNVSKIESNDSISLTEGTVGIPNSNSEKNENDSQEHENDIINEVLKGPGDIPRVEEDNILDSILSDNGQNTGNSESMNER